nr:MAG TPA: hypothetical protein [Caudoviricetes sp.]
MTPPRKFARYRAFTGSRGGIIPKGRRPHPPRGVGDAAPYNDLRTFPPSFTPALFAAWHTPGRCSTWNICRTFLLEKPLFYPFCLCYNRYKRP